MQAALIMEGGFFHGNHAAHAPAHRQRPDGGDSHQRHHRLCSKSAENGQREANHQLSM